MSDGILKSNLMKQWHLLDLKASVERSLLQILKIACYKRDVPPDGATATLKPKFE